MPRQFSGEQCIFNKWYWNNQIPTRKKNEPHVLFHSRYKSNSKSILELNFKGKPIILWEENTGVNLQDLGLCNDFLEMTLKVQAINLKRQIGFIKIKLCFKNIIK